jgi:hypothetical protein
MGTTTLTESSTNMTGDPNAVARCCRISATMLEMADNGETYEGATLKRIRDANNGQAQLLRAAADISDEMLAALKDATYALALHAHHTGNEDCLKAARAAIAKTEGR